MDWNLTLSQYIGIFIVYIIINLILYLIAYSVMKSNYGRTYISSLFIIYSYLFVCYLIYFFIFLIYYLFSNDIKNVKMVIIFLLYGTIIHYSAPVITLIGKLIILYIIPKIPNVILYLIGMISKIKKELQELSNKKIACENNNYGRQKTALNRLNKKDIIDMNYYNKYKSKIEEIFGKEKIKNYERENE